LGNNTKKITEVPESCKALGRNDAYLMVDGECKYAFNEGYLFTGIAGEEKNSAGENDYIGFKLEMNSSSQCGEGKFTVTINAYCDEKKGKFKVKD
jgi:hypothetical protein